MYDFFSVYLCKREITTSSQNQEDTFGAQRDFIGLCGLQLAAFLWTGCRLWTGGNTHLCGGSVCFGASGATKQRPSRVHSYCTAATNLTDTTAWSVSCHTIVGPEQLQLITQHCILFYFFLSNWTSATWKAPTLDFAGHSLSKRDSLCRMLEFLIILSGVPFCLFFLFLFFFCFFSLYCPFLFVRSDWKEGTIAAPLRTLLKEKFLVYSKRDS